MTPAPEPTKRAVLEQAENSARGIAKALADAMPDGWLFSLQLWTAGEKSFMTYISNANREDMKKSMRELLEKWEKEEPHV
jgi:hypothetical protein